MQFLLSFILKNVLIFAMTFNHLMDYNYICKQMVCSFKNLFFLKKGVVNFESIRISGSNRSI